LSRHRRNQRQKVSDSRAKQILARSLYNEFVKDGWSRSDILDYVNILLDIVIKSEDEADPKPLIDTETGFVTRTGFQELLLHQLDPTTTRSFAPCVLLVQLPPDSDQLISAEILRNMLRVGDVVAPLRHHRVAVYLDVPIDMGVDIRQRLSKKLEGRLGTTIPSSLRSLEPSMSLRPLWSGMLRELQAQNADS
jgi:hypothetical protein